MSNETQMLKKKIVHFNPNSIMKHPLIILVTLLVYFGISESRSHKKQIRASAKIQLDSNQNLEVEDNGDLESKLNSLLIFDNSELKYLKLEDAIPGQAGVDYPILGSIPYTNFYCDDQKYPGFFADKETRCQTWHYCDIDGRQTTFLCPNGTLFNQIVMTCDWWFNVDCELSEKLYVINSRLYGRRKRSKKFIDNHRKITKQLLENIFV